MVRKRKTEAPPQLDEADRALYATFCSAANSLSQLYTHAMAQQKLSFQDSERHALEKLYQWILRKHEEESRVTVADIMAHIQYEMDHGGSDAHVSPRVYQHPQSAGQFTNQSNRLPAGLYRQATAGFASRASYSDQPKNTVFSNALSSPVHRRLQTYHLAQGAGNGAGNNEVNSASSNDTSMDIVSDSAANQYY